MRYIGRLQRGYSMSWNDSEPAPSFNLFLFLLFFSIRKVYVSRVCMRDAGELKITYSLVLIEQTRTMQYRGVYGERTEEKET